MCPPPQHHQLTRESWIQIVCFLLALANLLTFTKLLYDYYQYKVGRREEGGLIAKYHKVTSKTYLGQWKAPGDNPLDSNSLVSNNNQGWSDCSVGRNQSIYSYLFRSGEWKCCVIKTRVHSRKPLEVEYKYNKL